MRIVDIAFKVLLEEGEPLHYRELAHRMIDQGLWKTRGKTPHDIVYSRLLVDMQKYGDESRFRRTSPGMFGLADYSPQPALIRAHPKGSSTVKVRSTSFTNAAEQILSKRVDKKPMHYRGITEIALRDGMIMTQGKTPESTMYAQIHQEIDRSRRRGERSRFVNHGKGFFGLSRWSGSGLAFQIQRHNEDVRQRLLSRVRQVDPIEFEAMVGRVLTAIGFDDVTVTRASSDGGVDVRGTLVIGDVIRTRMAVQAKRWKGNVQTSTVREVRGSLGAHEQGLIITTSDFSSGARLEAERADATPVGLMNGEQFVNLMIEHDIGIHRASHDIIELGEEEGEE